MILIRREIGDVLRERRKEQGRTLREVSASAAVSLGYLSEVERGEKEASSELLASICDALELPVSRLLSDVSERVVRRTPLVAATADGRRTGFWLKCENLQVAGAFKIRGAANMVRQLSADELRRGVITYSSGNHGQALACAAAQLDAPAVVVMPTTAPQVKVAGARGYGAEVIFAGTTSAERKHEAERIQAERQLTMVPPFDHPWIIAGQGTLGIEILEDVPDATDVYVPAGGGACFYLEGMDVCR